MSNYKTVFFTLGILQIILGISMVIPILSQFIYSEIDSSFTRGAPIEFTCGVGQVIKGWDEAMELLNKGSKARLVIPSELGYGSMGAGNGVIPPNATLIFDVELVDIK